MRFFESFDEFYQSGQTVRSVVDGRTSYGKLEQNDHVKYPDPIETLSNKQNSTLFLPVTMILILFSVLWITCLTFSVPVYAASTENAGTASTESAGYMWLIDDEADLLTDEEEEALYDSIDPLLEYGNVIFSTVTLPSGADYQGNCEDVYYYHFGNEPGVHFQIDMGNRKLTLSASTEMEDAIGSERDSIVDNIYQMATTEDYYGCAAECFREILVVVNDGKIAHSMKYIDNAILAFILALILNFVLVFVIGSKRVADKALVGSAVGALVISNTNIVKGSLIKQYSPRDSDGGGSSGGGGGGGGGFSGGSSSHGF